MMTKNEIEARMRWTHRSRRAVRVGRANPPNFSPGHGRKVGLRGTPLGLSVRMLTGALSAAYAIGVVYCR